LKENVIIGKLIPAGTGFVRGRFGEETMQPFSVGGEDGGDEPDDDLYDPELDAATFAAD
jgi:hypothetical protein